MQTPATPHRRAIPLLLACAALMGACGTLEVGVEYATTPDRTLTGTVEALQTDNARLATQLATLNAVTPTLHTPALKILTPVPSATLIPTANPDHNPSPSAATATPTPECAVRSEWPMYTVVRGDTLYAIARAADSTVKELATANCLEDPDRIYVGQRLHVPNVPVFPTDTPAAPLGSSDTPAPTLTRASLTGTPAPTVPLATPEGLVPGPVRPTE